MTGLQRLEIALTDELLERIRDYDVADNYRLSVDAARAELIAALWPVVLELIHEVEF
jgi:hypothetical protein